jgi:hypothetical protein
MKKVQLFENYINEAARFDIDVEKPFEIKDEKKAVKQFKIVTQPVTILEVEGEILEDSTDIEINFSNGDILLYKWTQRNGNSPYDLDVLIGGRNGNSVNLSKHMDDYAGSTGSVIGDLGLIYKDFKLNKIKR